MAKMTIETGAANFYHISIGVGKIYGTRHLEEVKTALDHYFKRDSCQLGSNPNCPLCRAINEEMAKKRRRG